MTFALNGGPESLTLGQVKHWCRLWHITRTDSTELFLTDAASDIVFGGNTYTPIGGFNSSAIRSESRMNETTLEYRGVLNADQITADDLYAGLYSGAKIVEYLVDARYPWAGSITDTVEWIDEVSFNEAGFTATVSGLQRWLKPKIGFLHSRSCMWELGDTRCKVAIGSLTLTGASVQQVFAVTPRSQIIVTLNTGGSVGNNYFQEGTVTWTDSLNTNFGHVAEISKSTEESIAGSNTTHRIYLYLKTPYDIKAGDIITIVPGCDKSRSTCISRYSNIDNFGGFPFMPGTDRMIQGPD